MLLNKFKGAMIGGLIGDCLGATFEMKTMNMIPERKVQSFLDDVKNMAEDEAEHEALEYTDDTAMARQISKSFLDQKKIDCKHVAQCFTEEYFHEPWRGYGGSVVEVFKKLRDSKCEEPFRPAAEQFSGSGSYGNGAGMRAHPVALACYNDDSAELIDVARDVARLTHSHHLGVTGGIVQSLAVFNALHADTALDNLKKVKTVVNELEREMNEDTPSLYKHKIDLVEKHVDCGDDDLAEVMFELGNEVSAVDSVPTAFFCYLKISQDSSIPDHDKLEAVLKLAVRAGGDTDTIASMACSIAGADLGLDNIPTHLYKHCEAATETLDMAEQMFNIVTSKSEEPESKKQRTD